MHFYCHLYKLTLLFGLLTPILNNPVYAERSGENIFNTYCIACHASGVANAPKFGSQADWLPHIEKGMDTLLQNATKGINAMPPKGLCFDCNDTELQNAIQFMLK